MSPRRAKNEPRRPQEAQNELQKAPGGPKVSPRRRQKAQSEPQEAPGDQKLTPGGPQEKGPSRAKMSPRRSQHSIDRKVLARLAFRDANLRFSLFWLG